MMGCTSLLRIKIAAVEQAKTPSINRKIWRFMMLWDYLRSTAALQALRDGSYGKKKGSSGIPLPPFWGFVLPLLLHHALQALL